MRVQRGSRTTESVRSGRQRGAAYEALRTYGRMLAFVKVMRNAPKTHGYRYAHAGRARYHGTTYVAGVRACIGIVVVVRSTRSVYVR